MANVLKLADDAMLVAKLVNGWLGGGDIKLIKIFRWLYYHDILIYHASKSQLIDIFSDDFFN